MGSFTGALSALDFGSGQERGIRGEKRQLLEQKTKRRVDAGDGAIGVDD